MLFGLRFRYWWLRSPFVHNDNAVRIVDTDGDLDFNNANNTNAVAPDCVNSRIKVGCVFPKSEHTHKERLTRLCTLIHYDDGGNRSR